MKRFFCFSCLIISSLYISFAQNSAIDISFQNRISLNIKTGFELIQAGAEEDGRNYLKEAIKVADERSHDYIASVIVINEKAIDPIIDYYYSIDSVVQARHYVDLHAELYKRYPESLRREKELTEEQYADYLAACYSITAEKARRNHDNVYLIKYLEYYIENAKSNNLITDEFFVLSEYLIWTYLQEGQYLNAISLSIGEFDDKEKAGFSDEEAIRLARDSYNWANRECRSIPSKVQLAKEACDIWISFINPLYEKKGESYMDSLLMRMDGHDNWKDEIVYDMTSSTMIAARMSQCSLALRLDGYDAAKQSLFGFRKLLYDKSRPDLWPIACYSFLVTLENLKLHSATYSFCKTIELDYLSQNNISQNDLLDYYIYFMGACDRVGDIKKSFEICQNYFEQVKETDDLYWLVSRLKGSFYLQLGLYEKSLTCMLSALSHYKFPEEPKKGDAIIYSGLYAYIGQAYRRLGMVEEAIEYYEKGIAICEQYIIPENKLHPYFDLGLIYYDQKELLKARENFLICVDIQTRTDAKYETSYPFSYLYDIERRLGNVDSARLYLEKAWHATLDEYLSFRDYLTIQEQTAYWAKEGDISFLGGLVAQSAPSYNDIYYDMLLASKGFLLKAETEEYNNVISSGDSRLVELYLSTHSGDNNVQEEIDEYMSLYRSHIFKTEIESTSWKRVQSMLSKNDLAIEFFRYDLADMSQGSQYGALVIKTGWAIPKFYHICSSSELERATKMKQRAYSIDGLLFDLIWAPLSKELKGIKNVYYSPQGLLHTLNLSAISDNKGRPMFKSYNMYRISSTQNINGINNSAINKSYVYGGLIYDSDDQTMLEEHRKYSLGKEEPIEIKWVADTSVSRHGWSYLPNTKTEIETIEGLLEKSKIEVTVYSGVTGTEESFKAISGTYPGLIHLATHGFYLYYSYADSTAIADSHEKQMAASQNALIRSGLILSNGGRAWNGEPIPDGVEDGILQADEIANVNLAGTSLLVLSACETALGDISSDGVYGLQRAFKMSGVGTIIMSLWEVDDKATSLFMSFFYDAWTSGKSKHDAFSIAQDCLRQQYSDPYYWAAFIMLD